MKKVGIYSGSFNPIHCGHLIVANYMVEFTDLDEIWFLVTPKNPLKPEASLIDEKERLIMTEMAIQDDSRFKICDVEFYLPRPSYTIVTLNHLSKLYPQHSFTFICGMDSLQNLHKWKDYQDIIDNYRIFVYPRDSQSSGNTLASANIQIIQAPKVEISSTFIRNSILQGKDVRHFMPERSYQYLIKNQLLNKLER